MANINATITPVKTLTGTIAANYDINIKEFYINEAGDLIAVFTNGRESNLGSVIGGYYKLDIKNGVINFIPTESYMDELEPVNLNDFFISAESAVGKKTANGGEIFNDYENNQASGKHSHAENNSIAEGEGSHAENNSKASGKWSHSENQGKAIGTRSHAEGSSTASGTVSHAEGSACKATNTAAHAEGTNTEATGQASHAQGNHTSAQGSGSHAAGNYSRADGAYSHSEGHQTKAYGEYQWAIGKWNKEDKEDKYAFMIGNGKGPNTDRVRSNAFAVDWDGNGELLGKLTIKENPTNDMDVATKNYVDNELATFDFIKVIDELPETGLPNKIYLVPKANAQNNDLFDEYIWTNEAWEFITTKQVEIDLTDYVKNTDYANITTGGVVKTNGELKGVGILYDGTLYNVAAEINDINAKTSNFKPIVPLNLDYATKVGITTNTIPLTAEEQAAAQSWLGGSMIETIEPDENGEYKCHITEMEEGLYCLPIGTVMQYNTNPINTKTMTVKSYLIVTTMTENEKNFILFSGGYTNTRHNNLILFGYENSVYGQCHSLELNAIPHLQYSNTFLGNNTFSGNLMRTKELAADDNSTNIPNTAWVNAAIEKALTDRGL